MKWEQSVSVKRVKPVISLCWYQIHKTDEGSRFKLQKIKNSENVEDNL